MLILSLSEKDAAILTIDPRELLRRNPNGELVKISVRLLRWPNGTYRVGLTAPKEYVHISRKLRKPKPKKKQEGGDQCS